MKTSIQDLSQREIYYVSGGVGKTGRLEILTAITVGSIAISIALDGVGGLFLSVGTSGTAGVITMIGTAASAPLALPVAMAIASGAIGTAVFYSYRRWFSTPSCKCPQTGN